MLDTKKIIPDFPILGKKINGKPLIYLDSTASSLKPAQVIRAMDDYYQRYGVNIFRGVYKLSETATEKYESARSTVASFIGSKEANEIIFVRNATEAVNLVAATWGEVNVDSQSNIISTVMEHHANIVPWQQLVKRKNAKLNYLDITEEGRLQPGQIENKINVNTRLIALTYVSNVLGTINPVAKIIKIIKEINPGVKILVDAAQAVPHMKIDVNNLGADFLVFSGHKMLGPTGIGVLWAKGEIMKDLPPYQTGGDMIREVYLDRTVFNDIPHRFEAGTPHIAGAIGLAEAVRYLDSLGMDKVRRHEEELAEYALSNLTGMKEITVYGPHTAGDRAAVVAFNAKGVHPHDMAQILDRDNICIRSGHHCAMPLHTRLQIPASCRASFYIYNTKKDVDLLIEGILKAKIFFE
ncbi:cysteine desulfurase [Candidatus Gottesmanbacteria bacterium RIFCSPHIGHO2_12_FULL_40_13]|uniref:cysteine desulfurase n=1 Tax=Candidatus Gottesmanbacteria bacterium RIFCSPHIGHO2_01_FULL_40_15 TaxID=1798376 RepID=A0A1F5YZV9_9BACT|nr:MAG: cysteine desulfurase [Candidatus Gottesmanbacteria bacterium RIFCSPHIGHO2_01_FULL_40_15]OGG24860.1 MAG: cysteine desulfurase [Candidatus Gottesmanbacteria bacterium RIFCSPHIGHO2_12_FULL_40_13]